MIIRIHSRTFFAIAYGILQNREEAEDVVQDSLIKAWKTCWRVRDPDKFPAWLATIARHRAHDLLRRRRTISFTAGSNRNKRNGSNPFNWFGSTAASALATLPGASSRSLHFVT